jgi:hypothetical protein
VATPSLQPNIAKAPQYILEIKHTNPDPPSDFSNTGAATITYGKPQPTPLVGGAFPSIDARQEWKQVVAPEEDYEVALVGASGWVLDPGFSGADLPFDHPFGFDWEFMLAVDQPPDDPTKYTSLLARGNQVPEEDAEIINRARDLQIPLPEGIDKAPSLLGLEIDGGLVPKTFSDAVAEGDRIAVFGRWIVDCGHAVKVQVPTPGSDTFRSEIHPPLVMAAAKVASGSLATGSPVGPPVTRVLFTSRPYLVSQRFTTDVNNAYDDTAADDGPFVPHLISEVGKVNSTILGIPTESVLVEAHPKIKSHPFSGAYLAHFVVRPPTLVQPGHGPGHGVLGGVVAPTQRLVVSFQFTVRSGCAVQVIPGGPNSVDVLIAMSHAGYTSPPLPERHGRRWSKDELSKLNPDAGSAYTDGEWISAVTQALNPLAGSVIGSAVAVAILERGIETDEYDCDPIKNVNTLNASHAVGAPADNIPVGPGVVQDDTQPYPVFGWLELAWVSPQMHP